jgi:hypothetical protein
MYILYPKILKTEIQMIALKPKIFTFQYESFFINFASRF